MGSRLRVCRLQSRMTQEKMAELLDISLKHYSEVERGITGLSINKLLFLSNFFGISTDYLLKGEENKETIPFILMDVYSSCPDDKKGYLLEMFRNLGSLINAEANSKSKNEK